MSAPGPTGERQEHLDAIVSFAGADQRGRLFRELDILTIKWRQETCQEIAASCSADVLEERKGPDLKAVRRRRVQEVTTDIQKTASRRTARRRHPKSSAHSDGRVLAEIRLAATFGTQ